MNSIQIIPKIIDDMFVGRILMSDYNISTPTVFSITARRNDGTYQTERFVYPDDNFDYKENLQVFFFGMSHTAVAQIVSVRINNQEIMTYFQPVDDISNAQARYDDSLVRSREKVNINKINLSFQVINTYDPKTLQVADMSDWGMLEDRKAIIEIVVPGFKEPVVFYLAKNMINTFTSPTLGLNCNPQGSCGVEYLDLPDGIYDITIKGSPSKYHFNRKYLKTDILRKDLDALWIRASVLCDNRDDELMEKIKEIEYCLSSAEANTRLCNIREAHALLDKAQHIIEIANNCINCK